MAEPEKVKLPKKPVYQWFYDGKRTKKIIEWLMALEDNGGDLSDVDLNNPELESILKALAGRTTTLEELLNGTTSIDGLVNEVDDLQTDIINKISYNDILPIPNSVISEALA